MGMVVTISPSLSLYKMVVFPAASRPTMRILISFLPQSLSNSFENVRPIVAEGYERPAGWVVEKGEMVEKASGVGSAA